MGKWSPCKRRDFILRPSLKRDIHRIELCGLEVQAHDKEEKTSGIMAASPSILFLTAAPFHIMSSYHEQVF